MRPLLAVASRRAFSHFDNLPEMKNQEKNIGILVRGKTCEPPRNWSLGPICWFKMCAVKYIKNGAHTVELVSIKKGERILQNYVRFDKVNGYQAHKKIKLIKEPKKFQQTVHLNKDVTFTLIRS